MEAIERQARYCFVPIPDRTCRPAVSAEQNELEARLQRAADSLEEGGAVFRNDHWCGQFVEPQHFLSLTEDDFDGRMSTFPTRVGYQTRVLQPLEVTVDHLEHFDADSVSAVFSKHLGSSVEA